MIRIYESRKFKDIGRNSINFRIQVATQGGQWGRENAIGVAQRDTDPHLPHIDTKTGAAYKLAHMFPLLAHT